MKFEPEQKIGRNCRSREKNSECKIAEVLKCTKIEPKAVCPKCEYELSDEEIAKGWREDPLDYTTQCPECGHRFNAVLILQDPNKQTLGSHTYLCEIQLFHKIEMIHLIKLDEPDDEYMLSEHPNVFWNMIKHFRSFKSAKKQYEQYAQKR